MNATRTILTAILLAFASSAALADNRSDSYTNDMTNFNNTVPGIGGSGPRVGALSIDGLVAAAMAAGVTSVTVNQDGTYTAVYGGHQYVVTMTAAVQTNTIGQSGLRWDAGNLVVLYPNGIQQGIVILAVR